MQMFYYLHKILTKLKEEELKLNNNLLICLFGYNDIISDKYVSEKIIKAKFEPALRAA